MELILGEILSVMMQARKLKTQVVMLYIS